MRLYAWPLDIDDRPLCNTCTHLHLESGAAEWLEEMPQFTCCTCGGVVTIQSHDLPNPPTEPRAATTAEQRAIGFGCDGDDQCRYCALWSMDGEYPICKDCEACTECGCKCVEVAREES